MRRNQVDCGAAALSRVISAIRQELTDKRLPHNCAPVDLASAVGEAQQVSLHKSTYSILGRAG
jgi:hypothetical protein